MELITLTPDSPCPNCGGLLLPALQPTAEQRARAADRDDPVPLSPHVDTAAPAVVADKGPLYRCAACEFATRLKGTSTLVWPPTRAAIAAIVRDELAKAAPPAAKADASAS